MRAFRPRAQPYALAGGELVPLSEYCRNLLPADACEELRLRTSGLDDDDFGLESILR